MSDSDSSRLSSAPSNHATPLKTSVSPPAVAPRKSNSRKRPATVNEKADVRVKRVRKVPAPTYAEVEEVDEKVKVPTPKKRTPRGTKFESARKAEVEEDDEFEIDISTSSVKFSAKGKGVVTKGSQKDAKVKKSANGKGEDKPKIKRKTKEEKEAEAMPLAARTIGSKILVGAHVSAAGGVHNAIINSVHIGGNALALFLKSQRKWQNPDLQDIHLTQFLSHCKEHAYDHTHPPPIVPHGSYLVNLAHPAADRTEQAYTSFIDDLDRCRKLGIILYNFHPGNAAASETRADAIAHLASNLNKAHKDSRSGKVITLLETMATHGNTIGSTFEDIAQTIDLIDDKSRVGVCLDTCHVFAAGYDLRTPEAYNVTMETFEKVIGIKYLKALHINDSKAPFNSGRDLHANIGTGFLGLRAFHNLVNDSRIWGLPLVLETPIDVKDSSTGKSVENRGIWAREIKVLESLVGMDVDSKEFAVLETELHEAGKLERERIQAQVDKKSEKTKAREGKTPRKRKSKAAELSSEEDSES